MDRSGTGSRRRQTPSISQRLRLTDHHHGVDALSNASLMEIETRSRAQTPSACTSTVGVKTRLKDVSNALTTSKELLKIINRVWGHEDRPSTSMSLISALHAELERARLQVNQLIQDQRSDQSEISYLIKCFAEEKAAWESKEQEIVEAAIESVAGELEVERKLRRRLESLNKKLGRELAETKASLVKVVKELESEKRAREIVEQVCDELARDVGEDNIAQVEEEVKKTRKEVEEEREMMQLADVLREGKVQMKLAEAKHQVEEKNSAVDKLRNQLEAFLGTKRGKERGGRNSVSHHHRNDDDIAALLSRTRFNSYNSSDEKDEDGGEVVEDGEECEQVSAESDLHSIELNMDNHNKSYKWNHNSGFGHDPRMAQIEEEETRGRKSTSGRAPRRSTTLQRSISDGVELHNSDRLDWGRLLEIEKQSQGKGYADELMQGYKSVKGLRDQMLSNSGMVSPRVSASPTRQMGPSWPSRDLVNAAQERTAMAQGGLKSRLAETGSVGHNARKSRR
ncbi:hypothetical protein SO802_030841 [Lithocarpus litseifolius]|uniref:Uncharacterized protein n=1 Tax=Lithocarpus litseifolius TaxID=425828 RepID=A0AAW2BPA4_9ROSI